MKKASIRSVLEDVFGCLFFGWGFYPTLVLSLIIFMHLSMSDHVYLRHLSTECRSILSADMATDTRPIYRPTLGRYIDRHSADMSAETRSSVGRHKPTSMSADTRPILHRHSADTSPPLGRHSAATRPSLGQH